MAKLQLYLKGALFQEADIKLPEFKLIVEDDQENFEFNCRLREEYVQYQAKIFRLNFLRQILKCNNEFDIVLIIESRVSNFEIKAII